MCEQVESINENKPFFVATLNRSGFHLLASLVNSTKVDVRLHEASLTRIPILKLVPDFEVINVFRMLESDTEKSGTWGLKCHIQQLPMIERYLQLSGFVPQDMKWIWLRRRDKVALAESLLRAIETGEWFRYKGVASGDRGALEMDKELLCHVALESCLQDDAWELFFDTHDISPHRVIYEEFSDESMWVSTIENVLSFLEIAYESPLVVNTSLMRMGNRLSTEYREMVSRINSHIPSKYNPVWYGDRTEFEGIDYEN